MKPYSIHVNRGDFHVSLGIGQVEKVGLSRVIKIIKDKICTM